MTFGRGHLRNFWDQKINLGLKFEKFYSRIQIPSLKFKISPPKIPNFKLDSKIYHNKIFLSVMFLIISSAMPFLNKFTINYSPYPMITFSYVLQIFLISLIHLAIYCRKNRSLPSENDTTETQLSESDPESLDSTTMRSSEPSSDDETELLQPVPGYERNFSISSYSPFEPNLIYQTNTGMMVDNRKYPAFVENNPITRRPSLALGSFTVSPGTTQVEVRHRATNNNNRRVSRLSVISDFPAAKIEPDVVGEVIQKLKPSPAPTTKIHTGSNLRNGCPSPRTPPAHRIFNFTFF